MKMMETNNEKAPEKKPKEKFKSEFNTAIETLGGFHEIFACCREAGMRARAGDLDYCRPYYSAVYQLYLDLRTYMWDHEITKYDTLFIELRKLFDNKTLQTIPDMLDTIYYELRDKMQKTGFLIPVSVKRAGAVRLKGDTSDF